MTSSKEAMDKFITKLKNNEFEKETMPQDNDGVEMTDDFVRSQVDEYAKMISSTAFRKLEVYL